MRQYARDRCARRDELLDESGARATALADRTMWLALAAGLSLKTAGASLVLSPPLVISEPELIAALTILEQAIGEAARAG